MEWVIASRRREARTDWLDCRTYRAAPFATMTVATDPIQTSARQSSAKRGFLIRTRARLLRLAQGMARRVSSSLTRRIVFLNLAGLAVMLFGFMYLNQLRAGLIDARVQSLFIQGEIIAGAIASSATVENDVITLDPDKLLQLHAGQSTESDEDDASSLQFSINPEQVAPLLRRVVTPTRTRARIYDRDGSLLLDTRTLMGGSGILRSDLPPPYEAKPHFLARLWANLIHPFAKSGTPSADDTPAQPGKIAHEVATALTGAITSAVNLNRAGETIVSVGVPIQRFRTVRGVLLLSTQGGDIDAMIWSERLGLFRVFLVAAIVMTVLSFLLAGTIAGPVRRLAEAAERVRRGIKSRQEIPDFSKRPDEIGHLSGALRDMTQALYKRMDAIESFAADVAHELKNPLTSLRSAVETLPLARTPDSQKRLMSVIQHDVRRLNRLISDISDASRLDAELARQDSEPVELGALLKAIVSVANDTHREEQAGVELVISRHALGKNAFLTMGHDSRIGQVITNLIDNARSFSPPDKTVRVGLDRHGNSIEITVEDEGPGISEHALERIFERFYTDRPNQGFGQNSGLGLSISRQIVEAHDGKIWAENRHLADSSAEPGLGGGAKFTVQLPAAVA
ncbi:two-component system, OmpR family, sensor histidine kinase ChvG [Rhizobiales bacterium GAS191]|nr:two-component system, OmpR family, sensor histidine kinase ChvG [Rhizobiales bacterium GAS191]